MNFYKFHRSSRGFAHLENVLLHSEPLLVADGDSAVPPFVVVVPLLGVTENLFRVLRQKRSNLVFTLAGAGSPIGSRQGDLTQGRRAIA